MKNTSSTHFIVNITTLLDYLRIFSIFKLLSLVFLQKIENEEEMMALLPDKTLCLCNNLNPKLIHENMIIC